jgi:hypothetical protein
MNGRESATDFDYEGSAVPRLLIPHYRYMFSLTHKTGGVLVST